MARSVYSNTMARRITTGTPTVAVLEPLSNIQVTVRLAGTATAATIYQSRTTGSQGPTPNAGASGTNPFTTGASGLVEFWVDAGDYDIVIHDLTVPARISDVTLAWSNAPASHAATHQTGGSDVVTVSGANISDASIPNSKMTTLPESAAVWKYLWGGGGAPVIVGSGTNWSSGAPYMLANSGWLRFLSLNLSMVLQRNVESSALSVSGLTTQFRLCASFASNLVASGNTFNVQFARLAVSAAGGANELLFDLNPVAIVAINTPAASQFQYVTSAPFTITPTGTNAYGFYTTVTGTTASGHTGTLSAWVEYRHV